MTKPRPTLSFEAAIAKVAGHIGWRSVARICGRSQRTVRAWSEVEIPAAISMYAALALDTAYAKAGGDGAPFLSCYALRLQADNIAALASTEELARKTVIAIREGGEAHAALVAATRPGATEADRAIAEKEAVEAVDALTNTIATLRSGRRSDVSFGGPL
ncbi:hypothetical protein [Sphingomonas sp. PR090111-T3T-6A]|uniref:hypothetical protein n=1 Tax=Sphingomonas sp. PR090111-T3T-6A TaxID=685778 RepID=UPI000362CEA3|nr:hypothetical protein [Sphingomonas sp. PR090111-T3T-6A]